VGVGICRVGLEAVMEVVNGHMEKMNVEYPVEVGSNDGEEVKTFDLKEVVSCHLEIVVEVVEA
jgi:hypothetical protein